ncbi:CDC27 family protein [Salibacter sp.]|uniref:tetratricopeptide repeat protein n=1 Tax=Salibacter sp. TaxID=2010995 RepID=UPI0028708DCD|nr:CDC27 family protein [Salibacter sp.]MDR9399695.1 CDC27 family protein [Salibacter sp.]MDR9488677.1 CDC27 family protein [Salibacter sp.]
MKRNEIKKHLNKFDRPVHVSTESWLNFKLWAFEAWKSHTMCQHWMYRIEIESSTQYEMLCQNDELIIPSKWLKVKQNNQLDNELNRLHQHALDAYRNEDFEVCLDLVRKGKLLNGTDLRFNELAMDCAAELSDWELAATEANCALTVNPANARIFGKRGRYYRELGDFEQSAHDFEVSLALNPNQEAIRFELADVYFAEKRYNEAFEKVNECLRCGVETEAELVLTARIAEKLKNYKTANELYFRAYLKNSFNPQVVKGLTKTAKLLRQERNYRRAS